MTKADALIRSDRVNASRELLARYQRDDEEVKAAVKSWFRGQPKNFYETGIHALIKRSTKAVERGGDYIEK